ncbi:hypothetical protein ACSYAD_30970 [Acaryochloris marina NIES-2412]|uniref:hypothetical protein n=1 Tax=Acaryochloris marina TaxID=155978 RepID=UPI0040591AC4
MKLIVRQHVQKIIEDNPDAAQATAKVLDFLDRELSVGGYGWFENDPSIYCFFDRYCTDEDKRLFSDLLLDKEFVYKGERMVKTGETVARRIVVSPEILSLSKIDVDIDPSTRVYEGGLYKSVE